ncbi:hypothetical protein D1I00_16850 (plasmid) [Legionella pneumophila subsp. pneumophila]|nr:hypothetical protein D1I00_16850 [Legionella pneumophila subsp. pneumophila]
MPCPYTNNEILNAGFIYFVLSGYQSARCKATYKRALHLPARLLWSLRSNVDFLFLYSLEIPCKSRKILRMD